MPETPAEHLRHAISDALRHLDREAEHVGDKRFAGVARAILRGQTATLARLAHVEQERDCIRDRYDKDVHDFWGLNEKAKDAETRAEAAERRYEAQGWASTCGRRAEAAETALREIERALKSQDWSIERLEHQRRTARSIAQAALGGPSVR